MKFGRRPFLGAGMAAALLFVPPFVLPLGGFIAEAERLASEQFGDPVRIASLRLFLLPVPNLAIEGADRDARTVGGCAC